MPGSEQYETVRRAADEARKAQRGWLTLVSTLEPQGCANILCSGSLGVIHDGHHSMEGDTQKQKETCPSRSEHPPFSISVPSLVSLSPAISICWKSLATH